MDYYQKYLDAAIRFLSYRPRSEKEVKDNLLKKVTMRRIAPEDEAVQRQAIDQVVAFLKEQQFLNDTAFARWWISSRSRFKPRSTRIIQMELKQKGVAQEIITAVLSELEEDATDIPDTTSSNEQIVADDFTLAKRLLEKKRNRYTGLTRQELYQKAGGMLSRHGFSWDVVKRTIDDVFEKGV